MNHKDFLYFLIFKAFVSLREEGHNIENKKVFWISNFLHNLPLKLNHSDSEQDFQKLFESLEEAAKYEGKDKWFDSILDSYNVNLEMKKKAEENKK